MMDILRGEWNFTGYVVSDEGAIENQISFHHFYNNSEDAAAGSVNAGCNLELSGNLTEPVFMKIGNSITQTYWFHNYSLDINLSAGGNWYFEYTLWFCQCSLASIFVNFVKFTDFRIHILVDNGHNNVI